MTRYHVLGIGIGAVIGVAFWFGTVERFDATNPPRIFTEGGSAESSEDAACTARSDVDRHSPDVAGVWP